MEYLILILIVGMVYLRFHMNKEDETHEAEFDRIKDALDTAISESPYKIEPIVATKRKTKKRTVKKVAPKKKLKVTKRKTKKKTKRKTK